MTRSLRTQRQIMVYSIAGLGAVVLVLCAILIGVGVHRSSAKDVAAVIEVVTSPTEEVIEQPKIEFDSSKLQARSAIILDAKTGNVLYEKNSELPLPLASLTKIMTLYTASTILEEKQLSSTSTISVLEEDLYPEGDWGFRSGMSFNFQDLADAAILASSNDAAQIIARSTAGSVQSFVQKMNQIAKEKGLTTAKFDNPTGLDSSPSTAGAYASARDVARLLKMSLSDFPDTYYASRLSEINFSDVLGINQFKLKNTNKSVSQINGIRISKTGYTDLAGGNLAIALDAGLNQPIVIVVLGSTQEGRFTDVLALSEAVKNYMAQQSLTR